LNKLRTNYGYGYQLEKTMVFSKWDDPPLHGPENGAWAPSYGIFNGKMKMMITVITPRIKQGCPPVFRKSGC
jgi:hypothetical protein